MITMTHRIWNNFKNQALSSILVILVSFGFFAKQYINLDGLFKAKAIIVEEHESKHNIRKVIHFFYSILFTSVFITTLLVGGGRISQLHP